MPSARRQAIKDAREARETHVGWIEYARRHGPECLTVQTGGGVEHHERWVRAYDRILRELGAQP